MKAQLVLEDGSSFEGIAFPKFKEAVGEVVLNTAVVGYQEILSDPANAGKVVIFTYPLIGNYGVAKKFYESNKLQAKALIIKEKSRIYSNWQAEDSFDSFLKKENIGGLTGVDTRTLTVTIRERGEMLGIISRADEKRSTLLQKLKKYKKSFKKNFIKDISVKKITNIKGESRGPKIAVLDLGMSAGFIKQLKNLGCNIVLLPFDTPKEKILSLKPKGLIISSGPEQDESLPGVAKTVKELLGKIPMLGISLGHEVVGLALGGKLKRMKIGHHGVNYPVKSPKSYKGEITVQNHSFVIDEKSLKNRKDVRITLRNVNDNSIEEMESSKFKFISCQYYPASPGLNEVNEVFNRFSRLLKRG